MTPIGLSQEVELDIQIQIPADHKLATVTLVDVYERLNNSWQKTNSIKLTGLLTLMGQGRMRSLEKVRLRTESGPIAIDTNLNHCPAFKKGLCVIDSFQGILDRKPELSTKRTRLILVGKDPLKKS